MGRCNIQETNNPSCDIIICAESAIYVSSLLRLQNHITLQLNGVAYNSKQPISLFLHALSDEQIKIFVANVL